MRACADAPGKLVIAGEYAVLFGAPALVIAVNHRAYADVASSPDGYFHLWAPDLAIHAACADWQDGHLVWSGCDDDDAGKLTLVTAVLEQLHAQGRLPGPVSMHLDTSAFFAPQGGHKLGLGSSAALTVALTAAVCRASGCSLPSLATLVSMHQQMQGGRGSGLDVATSYTGGGVIYSRNHDMPEVHPFTWPRDLAWRGIWSGHSASTSAALARLEQWQREDAVTYNECMQPLQEQARRVAVMIEAGNSVDTLTGITRYAELLQALGTASGIDIVSAEHRQLSACAADHDVMYKSCGAGGGDIGVALSRNAVALERFVRSARCDGYAPLHASVDPTGLQCTAVQPDNGRQA